jgi:hypothetical protein
MGTAATASDDVPNLHPLYDSLQGLLATAAFHNQPVQRPTLHRSSSATALADVPRLWLQSTTLPL